MQSWIALIASAVIGSLVLLSFGRFSNDVTRDMYLDTLDNATYGTMDNTARVIDYDLSRIGQGVNDPTISIITQADSTDLRYVMDSDSNGALENVRYYLSTAAAASSSPNPNDRFLYRVIDGNSQVLTAGISSFKIKYYDGSGGTAATPSDIRTLEVHLEIENEIGYDNQYPKVIWQGKITPPSLVTF
jgi:hypothetical protein